MKSNEECEYEAGFILGRLQSKGFTPLDTSLTAALLVAYLIERQSISPKAARDAFVTALDNILNQVS